jgi:hypothetical protein
MDGPTPPRPRRESSTRAGALVDHDEGHALVAERCQEFLAVQVSLSNLVRGHRGGAYCRGQLDTQRWVHTAPREAPLTWRVDST